jgi:probable rRNA maturation factor
MSDATRQIEVIIDDDAWKTIPRVRSLVARAAAAAYDEALPASRRIAMCVALVRDRAIAELNIDFRGVKGPTDVLAFPQIDGGVGRIATSLGRRPVRETAALGDVIVAFGACKRGAREAGVALPHHVAHLVVHGALHLLGHDHAGRTDTTRMRRLERAALERLGIPDPYGAESAITSRSGRSKIRR